jgi:short-subunit dehydrogenase
VSLISTSPLRYTTHWLHCKPADVDISDDEIADSFNINVQGYIRVLKGVLPILRAQKSGTIINMGSILGIAGCPGSSLYCMTKAAIDSLTESLSKELAPFNIRVLLLMSGFVRTPFMTRYQVPSSGNNPEYSQQTADTASELADDPAAFLTGDPDQVAQRTVELVDKTGYGAGLNNVMRVTMGFDAITIHERKLEKLTSDLEKTRALAKSTTFPGLEDVQPLAQAVGSYKI